MIDFIKHWLQRKSYYVIADARDNSVTLSKKVFDSIGGFNTENDNVLVFKVGNKYAFTNRHSITEKTDEMKLQYNSKHECAGFECRVPTVNRIFYDYGLPYNTACKISVEVHECKGIRYYLLVPPSKRLVRRIQKAESEKGK